MEVAEGGRKKNKAGGSRRLEVPQPRAQPRRRSPRPLPQAQPGRFRTLSVTVTEPDDGSGISRTETVIMPHEANTLTTRPDRLHERSPSTFVKPYVKNSLFFFNFLFWLAGLVTVGIGVWIRWDKSHEIRQLLEEVVDPAVMVIIAGCLLFFISFFGCIGALRENIFCIRLYYKGLTAIVASQFIMLITVLILFSVPELRNKLAYFNPSQPLKMGVIKYTEDDDIRNMIDNVQRKFKCCGYGYSVDGYRDWGHNMYFNCSEDNRSPSRCGVPYSCCTPTDEELVNVMCGYDVIHLDAMTRAKKIYTEGCLKGFHHWIEGHILVIGYMFSAIVIPEVIAIRTALTLEFQVKMQLKQWR